MVNINLFSLYMEDIEQKLLIFVGIVKIKYVVQPSKIILFMFGKWHRECKQNDNIK